MKIELLPLPRGNITHLHAASQLAHLFNYIIVKIKHKNRSLLCFPVFFLWLDSEVVSLSQELDKLISQYYLS